MLVPLRTAAQFKEHILKAGYVEKITHFVEWPSVQNPEDSTFNISVIGNYTFDLPLKEIFSKVRVKDKKVRIVHISTVPEIRNSNIVIISGSVSPDLLEEILRYTLEKPILTISEYKGYCKRGTILNMLIVDNYIRYEINRNSLERSGLQMSSMLMNYAIKIEK